IDRLLQAEQWDQAIAKCDEAVTSLPGDEAILAKRQKAETEKAHLQAWRRFAQAVSDKDYDGALGAYNEIPDDSVYKAKASDDFDAVKRQYVALHLKRAQRLAAASKCEQAAKEADQVLVLDESNAKAKEVVKGCARKAEEARVEPPIKARPPKPTERERE